MGAMRGRLSGTLVPTAGLSATVVQAPAEKRASCQSEAGIAK